MQKLELKKYKKKELYPLFGYKKTPVGGSKKAFERKLTECCKWNTENCKTTEINIVEVYKQPLETAFKHGNTDNANAQGWNSNSNSKFVAAVLLNKIEYFQNNDKIEKQFITIKTLSERCGFKTKCSETANVISTEIKRNITKLERIKLIKVEKKYNAKINKKFIEISEDEYLKFKDISKRVWKSLDEPVVEKFNTFYQFINVVGENSYIKYLYDKALAKETNISFVFESYKLSINKNEDNADMIADLLSCLLDEDVTIQEKINDYITDNEDYFKEKLIKKQKENEYIPTGFGKGLHWYTKSLALATADYYAVVF